ncbi:galactokinase [Sorochytrium milnesiophthora]
MATQHKPTITVYKQVDDIYGPEVHAVQQARYDKLLSTFKTQFGFPASFVARAPGRVNIIGEHIDYAGFGVFPMAIDRDIVIAVGKQSVKPGATPIVKLSNMQSKYAATEFAHEHDSGRFVTIDSSVHAWSNYFKSGYKGVYENYKLPQPDFDLYCLIDSTLPAGSGLSSSAAFVVCTSIVTLYAADAQLLLKTPQTELTEIAVVAERYVGVNSGGMDQSISVMAKRGSAAMISFVPDLSAELLQLPTHATWVIAHSCVTADKHVSAPRNYNLRVTETQIGAAMLAKHLKLTGCQTFMDVLAKAHSLPDKLTSEKRREAFADMLALCDTVFGAHADGWTDTDAAAYLGLSLDELKRKYMSAFPVQYKVLKLHVRAKHVYSEALRVWLFRDACVAHADVQQLAALMNESQDSCRDQFECSCPELDTLCKVSRAAGAIGSRLTGAGWGGSSISVLPEGLQVDKYMDYLWEHYYCKALNNNRDELSHWLFATTPGSGAGLLLQ